MNAGGGGARLLPVSGLMLFCCCCVVGAGLLRECAWTGGPEIGCWAAAADCSCETRGSCQVVVLSRWLWTQNKSKHIGFCYATATWRIGNTRHVSPQTCFTCMTRCARTSALTERCKRHCLCSRVLWQECELSGHVLSWKKLAETTLVAKLVGIFSVCLQLISKSPGVICTVHFTFPLILNSFSSFQVMFCVKRPQ